MKKYIFTIAFALLGITSSMASKADTLRIYTCLLYTSDAADE